MVENGDELLAVLLDIRDLLSRIYVCHEERYLEIQRQRVAEKLATLEGLLTPERRRIFPLLFEPAHLPQVVVAERANVRQPTVSKFVSALLEKGLIEPVQDEAGAVVYVDKYGLSELLS